MIATSNFAKRYDQAIFGADTRAIYDSSDFFNVGDWGLHSAGPPRGLGEAATRLVERHLAVDARDTAAAMGVVLDVACGLGASTRMMARHYGAALVVGINFSVAQLDHARSRANTALSPARFAAMDAARLAVAANSVDRIHCVEAAFHFNTRFDFLREAHRVLRPQGKLILTDILYRRRILDVPKANLWVDGTDYRARCETAGFVVETFDDITQRTVGPFCDYVAAKGKPAHAKALRHAMGTYFFVVLRRPSTP
jgi:MPBQ/MSBQ methyltransferase